MTAALREGAPVAVEASAPLAPSGGSLLDEFGRTLEEQLADKDACLDEALRDRAEAVDNLNAARDDVALLRTRSREAAATIDALTRALADARAIIDGRLEPPTDAEIIAHWRAGGVWVHQSRVMVTNVDTAMRFAREQREGGSALRWVPVLDGRPYAWPVVKP